MDRGAVETLVATAQAEAMPRSRFGSPFRSINRKGRMLRIEPATVNPQGAAGNGVAGFLPAKDDDEVIAAVSVTFSPNGFTRNGRRLRAEPSVKATVKSVAGGIVPAEQ